MYGGLDGALSSTRRRRYDGCHGAGRIVRGDRSCPSLLRAGYVRRSLTRADVTSSVRVQAAHSRRCRLKPGRSARALVTALASARLSPNRRARHASQYERGGSASRSRREISEIRLRRRKAAIKSPAVPATCPLGSRGAATILCALPRRYGPTDPGRTTSIGGGLPRENALKRRAAPSRRRQSRRPAPQSTSHRSRTPRNRQDGSSR
jgi:hypothetical protein